MKRLTKWIEGLEQARISCKICGKTAIYECWSQENCTQTAVDRLAAVEDILGDDYDLERLKVMMTQCMSMREEVSERFRITGSIPVDRLRELVEADKDGRCVILPKEVRLKKGDRVWYADRGNGELESGTVFMAVYKDGKLASFSVDFDCGDFDEFSGVAWGECFFGSKQAAEAALAKEN